MDRFFWFRVENFEFRASVLFASGFHFEISQVTVLKCAKPVRWDNVAGIRYIKCNCNINFIYLYDYLTIIVAAWHAAAVVWYELCLLHRQIQHVHVCPGHGRRILRRGGRQHHLAAQSYLGAYLEEKIEIDNFPRKDFRRNNKSAPEYHG